MVNELSWPNVDRESFEPRFWPKKKRLGEIWN